MTETKMKPVTWHQRPRMNRIASIMYPGLADEQAQREMEYYFRQEGKQSPMQVRGGSTKPQQQRRR
jgi:hypothetical protein